MEGRLINANVRRGMALYVAVLGPPLLALQVALSVWRFDHPLSASIAVGAARTGGFLASQLIMMVALMACVRRWRGAG